MKHKTRRVPGYLLINEALLAGTAYFLVLPCVMARLSDEEYMKMALKWAQKAADLDEVPIGAVLVAADGTILSHGYNMRENWKTPLAHAEIIAIQTAAKKLQQWRLLDTTLYVTLEPCPMCAGALVQSRITRVVYGAVDPKAGATESLYQICSDQRLNHRLEITRGVLENECSQILKDFFRRKRLQKKAAALPTEPDDR